MCRDNGNSSEIHITHFQRKHDWDLGMEVHDSSGWITEFGAKGDHPQVFHYLKIYQTDPIGTCWFNLVLIENPDKKPTPVILEMYGCASPEVAADRLQLAVETFREPNPQPWPSGWQIEALGDCRRLLSQAEFLIDELRSGKVQLRHSNIHSTD